MSRITRNRRWLACAAWLVCLPLVPSPLMADAASPDAGAKQAQAAPAVAAPSGDEGKKMKTIGVLGGLGPQATMDFELRVHRIAQRTIPPRMNGGYPPLVVYYHRRPPVLLNDDHKPRIPLTPDPGLLSAARSIGASADFLVIVANFPHLIQPEIERASGLQVLSMIDVTLDAVRARGWKRVGVVGLGIPTIYTDRLATRGIAFETLAPEQLGPLDGAIFALMEGRDTEATRRLAHDAIAAMRARGVEGIILG